MTQPCPGYPIGESLNPPAHEGGWCCWACDHDWDDADCTCLEPPRTSSLLSPVRTADPVICHNCGSDATGWDPADGWSCSACGASDSDEP